VTLGVVVIGRNEGEKLRLCLHSVLELGYPVVYADSDSSDGSVRLADSLAVTVVKLDPSRPMNAARGRKEGFLRLLCDHPHLEYVLFLDGDCVLDEAFAPAAIKVMQSQPEVAVVCGRRSELHPEASVYNRIANLEWNTPLGERDSCGGDALYRVNVYVQAGGFDETVLAGEEPELCNRIRRLGYKVLRVDLAMSWHDMGMTRLSQWWRRGVRSGYGSLDVRVRKAVTYFDRQLVSAWVWVLGWPLLSTGFGALAVFWGGLASGVWIALLACSLLLLQVLRIARTGHARDLKRWDAFLYGALMMVNKWASVSGQFKWVSEQMWTQRGIPSTQGSAWQQDLLRYPKRPFLKEQSIWAIAVYRWGARLHAKPNGWQKRLEFQVYWLFFRLVETLTGICLPHNAKIGPGLRIHHFGGIFINPRTVIGANCTLRQGVTLGNRHEDGGAPIVGSNVDFGAYAQVLGEVRIGDNAKIGAMSVVLEDVPANCTVVGNPARVVRGGNTSAPPVGGE
jgi:serine acetyltransferase